jgi:splicing factor U2AF subunit
MFALLQTNMVSVDELRDDDEYADLAEDVEEECKRFGSVTGMEIPRPKVCGQNPARFGGVLGMLTSLLCLNL